MWSHGYVYSLLVIRISNSLCINLSWKYSLFFCKYYYLSVYSAVAIEYQKIAKGLLLVLVKLCDSRYVFYMRSHEKSVIFNLLPKLYILLKWVINRMALSDLLWRINDGLNVYNFVYMYTIEGKLWLPEKTHLKKQPCNSNRLKN